MEKEIPKEIFEAVTKLLNKPTPDTGPLTQLEEQNLEIICACYKNDKMLRTWIVMTLTVFCEAAVQGKDVILVDGFIHLREMISEEGG